MTEAFIGCLICGVPITEHTGEKCSEDQNKDFLVPLPDNPSHVWVPVRLPSGWDGVDEDGEKTQVDKPTAGEGK